MCFHLWKPLICYLFITTTFQITVDFMTQWNGGSKRALFSSLNFSLCVSVKRDSVHHQTLISHQRTSDLFFHLMQPNLRSDIFNILSSFLSYQTGMLIAAPKSHASVYSFTGASLKRQLSLRRIVCFISTLTVEGRGGEAGGLSPLTLMERHRFYGARLYWPVADIYFLVS